MKKTIYKTTILLEILHEVKGEVDGMGMEAIAREMMDGSFSGAATITEDSIPLEGEVAARALVVQGSDPEFFGMDAEGNSLDEFDGETDWNTRFNQPI
jgi:hypothetical protein